MLDRAACRYWPQAPKASIRLGELSVGFCTAVDTQPQAYSATYWMLGTERSPWLSKRGHSTLLKLVQSFWLPWLSSACVATHKSRSRTDITKRDSLRWAADVFILTAFHIQQDFDNITKPCALQTGNCGIHCIALTPDRGMLACGGHSASDCQTYKVEEDACGVARLSPAQSLIVSSMTIQCLFGEHGHIPQTTTILLQWLLPLPCVTFLDTWYTVYLTSPQSSACFTCFIKSSASLFCCFWSTWGSSEKLLAAGS